MEPSVKMHTSTEDDSPKKMTRAKEYASHLLEDSLLTGVSPLVKTKNVRRRIFKLTVLILSFAGFIYQTSTFISIVLTYPSVLDIQLSTPKEFIMPAITFCNNNGIRRTVFCEKYPEDCEIPKNKTEVCKVFPHYCAENPDLNNFTMPKPEVYKFEANVSHEELKDMGHQSSDFFEYTWSPNDIEGINDIEGPWRYPKFNSYSEFYPLIQGCYTVLSRVNSSLEPTKIKFPQFGYPIIHLTFDFEPFEYFRPDRKVGGLLSVHSPFVAVNPNDKGLAMESGVDYKVHLTMREEKLLPYPYKSDCVNYTSKWIENGRTGIRSREMCIQTCFLEAILKHCGCVYPEVVFPHEEIYCREEGYECFRNHRQIDRCYDGCKQDCESISFLYDVEERVIETVELDTEEIKTPHQSTVAIFFKDPEIEIYKYSPKYETIEIFSYIGGYIGVWLGMSLVAITDFMETLGLIICFCIRQKGRQE